MVWINNLLYLYRHKCHSLKFDVDKNYSVHVLKPPPPSSWKKFPDTNKYRCDFTSLVIYENGHGGELCGFIETTSVLYNMCTIITILFIVRVHGNGLERKKKPGQSRRRCGHCGTFGTFLYLFVRKHRYAYYYYYFFVHSFRLYLWSLIIIYNNIVYGYPLWPSFSRSLSLSHALLT